MGAPTINMQCFCLKAQEILLCVFLYTCTQPNLHPHLESIQQHTQQLHKKKKKKDVPCAAFFHYTLLLNKLQNNIDHSHLYFKRGAGIVGVHLKSSERTGRVLDVLPMMHATKKRDSGSDPGLAVSHTEQRSWGRATRFNTLWRGWHINQFGNIICHKWGCKQQPKSWLKALIAMPIRAVFTHITRPTCQIARHAHTERIHQCNWTFWLETCYFQARWCCETYCDWIDWVDDVEHQTAELQSNEGQYLDSSLC